MFLERMVLGGLSETPVTPLITSIETTDMAGWLGIPFLHKHSLFIPLKVLFLVKEDNILTTEEDQSLVKGVHVAAHPCQNFQTSSHEYLLLCAFMQPSHHQGAPSLKSPCIYMLLDCNAAWIHHNNNPMSYLVKSKRYKMPSISQGVKYVILKDSYSSFYLN